VGSVHQEKGKPNEHHVIRGKKKKNLHKRCRTCMYRWKSLTWNWVKKGQNANSLDNSFQKGRKLPFRNKEGDFDRSHARRGLLRTSWAQKKRRGGKVTEEGKSNGPGGGGTEKRSPRLAANRCFKNKSV